MDTMFDFGTMDLSKSGLEDGSYTMVVTEFKGYKSKAGLPWIKVKLTEPETKTSVVDYLPVPSNPQWSDKRWRLEQFWNAIGGEGMADFGTYDTVYGGFPNMLKQEATVQVANEVTDSGYKNLRVVRYGS